MSVELLDTESDENQDGGGNDRERDEVNASEKWSTYVERFSAPNAQQTSQEKDQAPTLPDNETTNTNNHPVSSDQAARGGRGRKRKNTDINKKI